MKALRWVFTFGILASSAFAAEEKPPRVPAKAAPAPKPPAMQGPRPPAQAPRPPQNQPAGRGANANAAGERPIDRFLKMTPQEREKALKNLPPDRRQNIENRIGTLQKLTPAEVNRIRNRQQMLDRLPPARQAQVKRSMQQFLAMPDDRRNMVNHELQKLGPLQDEDRRAYMNTEEFRNKYTAHEQQMMSHLAEITPVQP